MRRDLTILAVVVVLIIILLVIGVSLINVNQFRPKIQAELESKLGRPVTLGTMHLHIFPFSVQVDGLTIGQPPGFPANRPFAQAQEVYATAGLFSLIGGHPDIHQLTLKQPKIELIRNPEGVWNYSNLGNPSPAPQGAASQNKSNQQPSSVTLNDLKIEDGQVAVTDERARAPRAVYNHIDLTVHGFAPDKAFNAEASVHFPGAGKELLSFAGKIGPLASGSHELTPVNGHLSLQQVSVAGVNSVRPNTVPANTDGTLSGGADITTQSGTLSAKGNLNITNVVVQGKHASNPIEAQYSVAMNQANDQLQVQNVTVGMGPTHLAITGTVDEGVSPPVFNLHVGTENASIPELSTIAGLFGVAFDGNDQIKGDLTANLSVSGNASLPQITGTLSSNRLQAQELTLTNLRATTGMKDGVVQLAPVTANVYGGTEDGTITLQTKAAHPLCSVKTKLTGVDANALLSAVSSLKNTLYGSLATNADLSFTVDSSTNLARTLNGVVAFNLTNGQLKNVNIMNEIARIGKFLNASAVQSGNDTKLEKFSGTLDMKDGVASTNNLVAALPEGSLSANGSVNLVDQGLNMHVSAVLSNGTSKAVGGNSVGGFLNTALSNNRGELVIPVIVSGTTSHPVFAPDVESIAKMKLNHLLPTASNPVNLVNGILGGVLGGSKNGSNGQGQQQNPLGGLLNQLKKH